MSTATERLASIQADLEKAQEAVRVEETEGQIRSQIQALEKKKKEQEETIAELEGYLAELLEVREAFVKELGELPTETRHLKAQEEDRIRSRRQALHRAIAALDGDHAQGTLVDHLWNKPRITGTQKRIAKERELLEKAERALADLRRQLDG